VNLAVAHVVGDGARHDEIHRSRDVAIVARAVLDRQIYRRRRAGHGRALRIEVHPDQVDGDVPLLRPAGDPAQHVAMTEPDIQQPERVEVFRSPVQKVQRGGVAEGPGVHPREVVQDLLVGFRVQPGIVHLLLLPGADGQAAHAACPGATCSK
jgi:hypothetical protein